MPRLIFKCINRNVIIFTTTTVYRASTAMADPRIALAALMILLAFTFASADFANPGNYPIVYFENFKYEPTDGNGGYILWYRTFNGATYKEIGIVPYSRDNDSDSSPDTLGSSKDQRLKSKLPLKNRKVSPKLLASLSG